METKLKQYFPMIRERKEVLAEIESEEELKIKFEEWNSEQQNEFLDFVTGVKGLKLLQDGFFKAIMNPEIHPGRMDDFLSHMLKQNVKVLKVLPVDSTRIADESSLVVMDIVVELEDGSIANVEMQRVGYLFPGQRSACYSADLLLRQYKRVRDEKKKKFSYRDIKNVYTIVLYEKSPKEFKQFPDDYYHYFEQKSDTGIELELLQKYLFIPLDMYHKSQHNKNIKDKRNAWLSLLSGEDAEQIIELTEQYPEFKEIYREAYEICCNVEEVMGMFSKELYELDKNTVQYMMDEMQDELNVLQNKKDELQNMKNELQNENNELQNENNELQNEKNELQNENNELQNENNELQNENNELQNENNELQNENNELQNENNKLQSEKEQMHSTINAQKAIIEKSILNSIGMMRKLKMSDDEILENIQEQYQLSDEQVRKLSEHLLTNSAFMV